eukprot:GILK01007702.1.p1 GENE.GILK01007702.1~~GILK01007702.1.p1  ORF type:complete len:695 (-),score=89.24 GILK01007702.1:132-2216(-)
MDPSRGPESISHADGTGADAARDPERRSLSRSVTKGVSSSRSRSRSESRGRFRRARKRSPSRSRSRARSRSRSRSPYARPHSWSRRRSRSPRAYSPDRRRSFDHRAPRRGRDPMPSLDGPLLAYKHFLEFQDDNITPEKAQRLYDDYKLAHEKRQAELFFSQHKGEEWFKEKYHPDWAQKRASERTAEAKKASLTFIGDLAEGKFRGLKLEKVASSSEQSSAAVSMGEGGAMTEHKDEMDYEHASSTDVSSLTGAPYFAFDADTNTLFLRSIPAFISRWDVAKVVERSNGLIQLSLSEALRQHNFNRLAWAGYDNEENCNNALKLLQGEKVKEDFVLQPVKSKAKIREPKETPAEACSDDRIEADYRQSRELIECLDKEKEVEAHNLFEMISGKSRMEQLDTQIIYLRRVHSFCYYCGEEFEDERVLAAKCAPAHIRSSSAATKKTEEDTQGQTEGQTDEKKGEENGSISHFQQLADRLDHKIRKRIQTHPVLPSPLSDEDPTLLQQIDDFCRDMSQRLEDEKYRCKVPNCNKLFRGPDFVKKHINLKHTENLQELKNKLIEQRMMDAYLADPHKITQSLHVAPGQPVPHPPVAMPSYMMPRIAPMPYMPSPYMDPGYGPIRGRRNDRDRERDRDGSYQRQPREGGGRGRMPPGSRSRGEGPDSRPRLSYRDLDAPVGEDASLDFRAVVSYDDI